MSAIPTIEQAAARYTAARVALVAAADELRRLVKEDAKAVVINSKRVRRSWDDAVKMSERVREIKAANPRRSDQSIGKELGLSRDLVQYYRNGRKKG